MIKINEELLIRNYKEIQKECLLNGVLIPSLLLNYLNSIPKENKLSLREIEEIKSKLSDEIISKFEQESYNRDKEEYTIYHETRGLKKRKELIKELQEQEFNEWLKNFPQYNDLII